MSQIEKNGKVTVSQKIVFMKLTYMWYESIRNANLPQNELLIAICG